MEFSGFLGGYLPFCRSTTSHPLVDSAAAAANDNNNNNHDNEQQLTSKKVGIKGRIMRSFDGRSSGRKILVSSSQSEAPFGMSKRRAALVIMNNNKTTRIRKQNSNNNLPVGLPLMIMIIGLMLMLFISASGLHSSTGPMFNGFVDAKTHHSKRQVVGQQQQQQITQPRSGHFEAGNNNWWNLWWQQYINEAIQPEVTPIEAVHFGGKTIALAPEEPDDAGNGSGSGVRESSSSFERVNSNSNNQPRTSGPGSQAIAQREQRQQMELERNVRFLETNEQNQQFANANHQLQRNTLDDNSQFGIQMRNNMRQSRMPQSSGSSQQQRDRQTENQQLQEAIDDAIASQHQQQHQQLIDYSEEPELSLDNLDNNNNNQPSGGENQAGSSPSDGIGIGSTRQNFTDSSSSNMMMPEIVRPQQSFSGSGSGNQPFDKPGQPQQTPVATTKTVGQKSRDSIVAQTTPVQTNPPSSTTPVPMTQPAISSGSNNNNSNQNNKLIINQQSPPQSTGFGMRTTSASFSQSAMPSNSGTSTSMQPSVDSIMNRPNSIGLEREQPVGQVQRGGQSGSSGGQSGSTATTSGQQQQSGQTGSPSRVELVNGRPSGGSGRGSQQLQQQQQGTTTSSRLPTKSRITPTSPSTSTTPMPPAATPPSFQSTAVRQPPKQTQQQVRLQSGDASNSVPITPEVDNSFATVVDNQNRQQVQGQKTANLTATAAPADDINESVQTSTLPTTTTSTSTTTTTVAPKPNSREMESDLVATESPIVTTSTNGNDNGSAANTSETEIDSDTENSANSSDDDKDEDNEDGDGSTGSELEVENVTASGPAETPIESTTTTTAAPSRSTSENQQQQTPQKPNQSQSQTKTTTTSSPDDINPTTTPTLLTIYELQRLPNGANANQDNRQQPTTTTTDKQTSQNGEPTRTTTTTTTTSGVGSKPTSERVPMVMVNLADQMGEKAQDASDSPITMSMDALMRMVMMTTGDASMPQTTPKPLPTSEPESVKESSNGTGSNASGVNGIQDADRKPGDQSGVDESTKTIQPGNAAETNVTSGQTSSTSGKQPEPTQMQTTQKQQPDYTSPNLSTEAPSTTPRRPQSQPPPTTPLPVQGATGGAGDLSKTALTPSDNSMNSIAQKAVTMVLETLQRDNEPIKVILAEDSQKVELLDADMMPMKINQVTPIIATSGAGSTNQQQQSSSQPQMGSTPRMMTRFNEQARQQPDRMSMMQFQMPMQNQQQQQQMMMQNPNQVDVVMPGMRLKPLTPIQPTNQQQRQQQPNNNIMQPILSNNQVYMIMIPGMTGASPGLVMTEAHTKRPQQQPTDRSMSQRAKQQQQQQLQQTMMGSRPNAPAIMLLNSNVAQTNQQQQPQTNVQMDMFFQRQNLQQPTSTTTGTNSQQQSTKIPMQWSMTTRGKMQPETISPVTMLMRMQTGSGGSSSSSPSGSSFSLSQQTTPMQPMGLITRLQTTTFAPPTFNTNMQTTTISDANNQDDNKQTTTITTKMNPNQEQQTSGMSTSSKMTSADQPSATPTTNANKIDTSSPTSASTMFGVKVGQQQQTSSGPSQGGNNRLSKLIDGSSTTAGNQPQTTQTMMPTMTTFNPSSQSSTTSSKTAKTGPIITNAQSTSTTAAERPQTSTMMRMTQRELAMMRAGKTISMSSPATGQQQQQQTTNAMTTMIATTKTTPSLQQKTLETNEENKSQTNQQQVPTTNTTPASPTITSSTSGKMTTTPMPAIRSGQSTDSPVILLNTNQDGNNLKNESSMTVKEELGKLQEQTTTINPMSLPATTTISPTTTKNVEQQQQQNQGDKKQESQQEQQNTPIRQQQQQPQSTSSSATNAVTIPQQTGTGQESGKITTTTKSTSDQTTNQSAKPKIQKQQDSITTPTNNTINRIGGVKQVSLGTKTFARINGTSSNSETNSGPRSPSNQLRGATKSGAPLRQQPTVLANSGNQTSATNLALNSSLPASQTAAALRQFGGGNRMTALANQPVPFGRPASNLVQVQTHQSQKGPHYEVPSFDYKPSISVRRPDEPLANGQIPNCTLTGRNFCVLTNDYPMNAVRQAVERSFRSVRIMYEELQTVSDQELHKDDFVNATSSQAAMGQFACQTSVEMMRPGWAKDEITKEWMLVVNTDVFPQRVRTESCSLPNTPCEFIAPFYDSTCQQRYSLHRMIAIDPHDPSRSPQVAVFKFPAGCVCRVHPIKKSTPNPLMMSPMTTITTSNPSTTSSLSTRSPSSLAPPRRR